MNNKHIVFFGCVSSDLSSCVSCVYGTEAVCPAPHHHLPKPLFVDSRVRSRLVGTINNNCTPPPW